MKNSYVNIVIILSGIVFGILVYSRFVSKDAKANDNQYIIYRLSTGQLYVTKYPLTVVRSEIGDLARFKDYYILSAVTPEVKKGEKPKPAVEMAIDPKMFGRWVDVRLDEIKGKGYISEKEFESLRLNGRGFETFVENQKKSKEKSEGEEKK